MGGALTITARSERGVVIAAVTGEIDISTVAGLRERLFELADNGGTLIVDLNRVTFIDSAGLGALVGTARRVAEHGGSLHAVCARPQTRKLLWMTGIDRRIPLAATVAGSADAPGDVRGQLKLHAVLSAERDRRPGIVQASRPGLA